MGPTLRRSAIAAIVVCAHALGADVVIGTAANQKTPTAQANGWPVMVSDGTNTAAVEPANESPTAADPALVCSLSPNSSTIQVQGAAADGSPSSGNPVLVGGEDPTGKAEFIQLADAGQGSGALLVAVVGVRKIVGRYAASTGLIAGSASAQNIMSLANPNASGKNCYVKRAWIAGIQNAAAAFSPFLYHLQRTTGAPSGGTSLTVFKSDTGAAASVCTALQGPTATVAAGDFYATSPGAGFGGLATSNNWVSATIPAIDSDEEQKDLTIRPGEAILFLADANTTSISHLATMQWQDGTE